MIMGDGFFRVQMEDGQTAYTRDGNFKWDNTGRLVTTDGFPLVDEIVRPAGASDLTVGLDGVVTVNVNGEKQEIGQIQLTNFINPTGSQGQLASYLRFSLLYSAPNYTLDTTKAWRFFPANPIDPTNAYNVWWDQQNFSAGVRHRWPRCGSPSPCRLRPSRTSRPRPRGDRPRASRASSPAPGPRGARSRRRSPAERRSRSP